MRRGWFHLASGAGIGRIFGFASNLLLSRWLGPVDLGLFNLVTTTVQTCDTLVRCGGDYALNFELGGKPEAIGTEQGSLLARALAQLCSLSTIIVCFGTIIWVWSGQGLFPTSLAAGNRSALTILLVLMIFCECITASAWELLLVSHRTSSLALRQGLFFPLRLLFAAFGSFYADVLGAMLGWSLIAFAQCLWLKVLLSNIWQPLRIWPPLRSSIHQLLKRGIPFYAANLLASMIFYPLLLRVASASGLADIGYLRIGQILQQLFAFLPATLVPVLFLKLRGQSSFGDQVLVMEKPLRIIWLLLLEVLLLYCIFDQVIISWLFGTEFVSALLPTRLLLITALFESLSQLVIQPVLAAGQTRLYGLWQNGAATASAVLGWLWIPTAGIAAYLIVRLVYVTIPLIGFGLPVAHNLQHPKKIIPLVLASFALLASFLMQALYVQSFALVPSMYITIFVVLGLSQHGDLILAHQAWRKRI